MGRKNGLRVEVSGLASLPSAARRPVIFKEAVRRAFKGRLRRGEVAVVFVTRAAMLKMNRRFLGHDYDTDVITFQHESPPGVAPAERPIGDIFISAWMVRRQAAECGHSALREAATLAAHGALHLLGHEDATRRGKARMFDIQDRIVAALRA
ncbi:MAG: rRNA maturation RNase YbeY [Elusimicrobia bacterium]|nr:rRNA maturation RNase YbeY [Elusimicrobiota bacterium]